MKKIYLLPLLFLFLCCPEPKLEDVSPSPESPVDTGYQPVFKEELFPGPDDSGIKGAFLTEQDLVVIDYPIVVRKGSVYTLWTQDAPNVINVAEKYPDNIIISPGEIIIEKLNISGGIIINEGPENVIIRKCKIQKGMYGIKCNPKRASTLIEYCTLWNNLVEHPSPDCESFAANIRNFGIRKEGYVQNKEAEGKAILAVNCVIKHCDISGYTDGIICGENTRVISNYIHDLYQYFYQWDDSLSTADPTHSDGLQGFAADSLVIRHNFIDSMNRNAAIILQTESGPLKDVEIDNNYFLGRDDWQIYIRYKGNSPTDPHNSFINVQVKNNIFNYTKKDTNQKYNRYISCDDFGAITLTGNVTEKLELLSFGL